MFGTHNIGFAQHSIQKFSVLAKKSLFCYFVNLIFFCIQVHFPCEDKIYIFCFYWFSILVILFLMWWSGKYVQCFNIFPISKDMLPSLLSDCQMDRWRRPRRWRVWILSGETGVIWLKKWAGKYSMKDVRMNIWRVWMQKPIYTNF